MSTQEINDVYFLELAKDNYDTLYSQMISEQNLLEIAKIIKRNEYNLEIFVVKLLSKLDEKSTYNRNIDWNTGSTIQHFDPRLVINAFKKSQLTTYYNSIGLTWVFGEYRIKDEAVIEYLYKVIKITNNSDAWWRAAFSLEQLQQEEALTFLKKSLKGEGIKDLDYYLANLSSKKSVIGILLLCNNKDIKDKIYPAIRSAFLKEKRIEILINCIWLLGRFRLINAEILIKIDEIISGNTNYELVYYTCYAIQEFSSPALLSIFTKLLSSDDALLRKMAIRGISYNENSQNYKILEDTLLKENNPSVIAEITKGMYRLTNWITKQRTQLKRSFRDIENGLIYDDSDKWYTDPSLYDIFSLAEDPENICFNLILNEIKLRKKDIENPIDLATGTGRALRFFIENLNFKGTFYGIDKSIQMLEYTQTIIGRKNSYIYNVELMQSALADLNIGVKSDLIISSFGFPSKITDRHQSILELAIVNQHLNESGLFVTLGWDETFNDDLNNYWYKYVPDSIEAPDFETWRSIRRQGIKSPRNCDLTWYKTGITVPLQFNNIKEAARIMGNLFGRDAADHTIENGITEWSMSLGITLNTKEEIQDIINNNLTL